MPRHVCCVPGCSIVATDGVPLHFFPNPGTFAQRFKLWVKNIGGDIATLDSATILKTRRICRRHFETRFLYPKNRLSKLAVPTLHLPSGDISDKKMAPILYKVDASPPSNAVRILADIIGLELELRDRDFGTLEHKSPKHVKLNPMGTLPTLVDGDFVISESHATMKYLLSVYGGDKSESLYPSDVRTRALVDQAMFFNVGIYFIRLKVIVLPALFGDLDGPTEKHKADIDEAYGVVEAYLANNKYIVTDHLTIADLSVGATTVAFQYLYKLDTARFPRTAAWLAKLEEHPSFKKILIPGSKILGEIVNAAWQKNKK